MLRPTQTWSMTILILRRSRYSLVGADAEFFTLERERLAMSWQSEEMTMILLKRRRDTQAELRVQELVLDNHCGPIRHRRRDVQERGST